MPRFINLKKFKSQRGFSFIEILLASSIMMVLFGVITFNLLRAQGSASKTSNTDKLISDIRAQQIKAMTGATEGRTSADNYGIYFMSNKYILFHGASYNSGDPTNFTVDLPSDLEIKSTTLPSNTLLFSVLSGEMVGYSSTSNTVTVRSIAINKEIIITINRYGVITGVN